MKKSMRILFSVMLTLILVLGFSTTVYAAPSISNVVEIISAVDDSGNDVAVTKSTADVTLDRATAAQILGVKEEEVSVFWNGDITSPTLPVTITFGINGNTNKAHVFHYNSTEAKWELVASDTGAKVSAKFTNLSPVAIVIQLPTNAASSVPTGDNSNITLWAALMVLAAAGAAATVVYSRKRRV